MPRYKRPGKRLTSHQRRLALDPKLNVEIIEDFRKVFNDNLDDWKFSYQNECFLSKYVGPDTDPANVRRSRAIEKWLATELRNSATNTRLLIDEPLQLAEGVLYEKHLRMCRRIVRAILGDTPPGDILFGGFSGGASTSKTRDNSSPARKFLDKADVTSDAYDLAVSVSEASPSWEEVTLRHEGFRVVEGNVLFTVPKTTLIDRVACKEPDMNMFMQKGVGNFIRRRLKRANINLNDQSINQRLSKIGSLENSLSTLDLSSASDSVSIQLVYLMLPLDWFLLMDRLRSKVTMIDGVPHENHMFSSMGNGFTFELESLLFYAITRATAYCLGTRGEISVYGDDIIAPSSLHERLIEVLSFYGFSVNPDKSFGDGPFRESCGAHWYNGKSVTPFYLRSPVVHMVDLIHLLNSLRKWSDVNGVLDPRVSDLWSKYARLVPDDLWGGQDYAIKYALVTGHGPRAILVPHTVKVNNAHIGGYLHWLQTHDQYDGYETWVTSETLKVTSRYRVRRVRRQ